MLLKCCQSIVRSVPLALLLVIPGPPAVAQDVAVPPPVMDLLKSRCAICHIQLRQQPLLLLNRQRWLASRSERFVMEQRILSIPPHGMPPGNPLAKTDRTALENWFAALRAGRR